VGILVGADVIGTGVGLTWHTKKTNEKNKPGTQVKKKQQKKPHLNDAHVDTETHIETHIDTETTHRDTQTTKTTHRDTQTHKHAETHRQRHTKRHKDTNGDTWRQRKSYLWELR